MEKSALTYIEDELRRARISYNNLFNSEPQIIFDAWADFLDHTYKFFTKIGEATKKHPSNKGKVDRWRSDRRKEPLFMYIKEARNTDNHGLKYTVDLKTEAYIDIPPSGEIKMTQNPDGSATFTNTSKVMSQAHYKQQLSLYPAVNLAGNTFDPPTDYLGVRIPEITPHNIAQLALLYMEEMIVKIRKLSAS